MSEHLPLEVREFEALLQKPNFVPTGLAFHNAEITSGVLCPQTSCHSATAIPIMTM